MSIAIPRLCFVFRFSRRIILLITGLSLSASLLAQPATQSEVDELRQRLETLEQQLQDQQGIADLQSNEQQSSGQQKEEPPVKFGGALRYNYSNNEYSDDLKNRYGDTGLDIFRINADGDFGKLFLSAEYRFYRYMDTIHHGYVGYQLSDHSEIQGGITRVPFGLLPYAAHNFWFGVPYYLGMADDYDSGVKYQYARDGWDWQLAFFKNEELGNAGDLERYSYDPVTSGTAKNQEPRW